MKILRLFSEAKKSFDEEKGKGSDGGEKRTGALYVILERKRGGRPSMAYFPYEFNDGVYEVKIWNDVLHLKTPKELIGNNLTNSSCNYHVLNVILDDKEKAEDILEKQTFWWKESYQDDESAKEVQAYAVVRCVYTKWDYASENRIIGFKCYKFDDGKYGISRQKGYGETLEEVAKYFLEREVDKLRFIFGVTESIEEAKEMLKDKPNQLAREFVKDDERFQDVSKRCLEYVQKCLKEDYGKGDKAYMNIGCSSKGWEKPWEHPLFYIVIDDKGGDYLGSIKAVVSGDNEISYTLYKPYSWTQNEASRSADVTEDGIKNIVYELMVSAKRVKLNKKDVEENGVMNRKQAEREGLIGKRK